MTVFVDLHFVAGADPSAEFGFGRLVFVKVARAERLSQFVHMHGESLHHRFGDGAIRMHRSAALLSKAFDVFSHFLQVLF